MVEALQRVQDVQGDERDDIIAALLGLIDPVRVYDEALGLYDLELALHVAQVCVMRSICVCDSALARGEGVGHAGQMWHLCLLVCACGCAHVGACEHASLDILHVRYPLQTFLNS